MGNNPAFRQAAIDVGHWIGEHSGQLVYGGGSNGLMGVVADAALEAGARVIGVIPTALVEHERANYRCTELIVVNTMHQRKALLMEHANAFMALPGGIGTFEEIIEVWVWRQLGYHTKPLAFLNIHNYFDLFLQAMNYSMQEGFLTQQQMSLLHCSDNAQDLLARLFPDTSTANRTHSQLN